MTTITHVLPWERTLAELSPVFSARASEHDQSDSFVSANIADLREARLYSALVPAELGGGNLAYTDLCNIIRGIGRSCGSTALTFSMHQHLVAAAFWNFRRGRPGEKLLRTVAEDERVLVSTGATDWLASNGTLIPCDGGYRFTARKVFASGCKAGHLLVTSGQLDDPSAGRQVLHFAVPFSAEGVRIGEDWIAMGMRGTGSHTVVLDNVFVPEQAISLRRPCGEYHPVWNLILSVALPLICAAYVGIAEKAAELALAAASRKGDDGISTTVLGEMTNELTIARLAFESMVATVNNLAFEPSLETANCALIRKSILTDAVKRTTAKALEAAGGSGYYRIAGLEQLFRDSQAAHFHPMMPRKQHRFTGRLCLGLDPVAP